MDKFTKQDGSSPDIVAKNVERLRELFPEVFGDGTINVDALKETLGEYIDDREERYSFTWHGKSKARQIAQMPSAGTLRPCPNESVNWDITKNIFIEGDNLEVLKLLQKNYHRKVKMIYIDPPYNTGKEFIYPDKFQDNLDTYLKYTGQVDDEGFKLSANSETSGRYHTNWLNMMYPRLKLARNLLRDDGIIFVSIDDHEVHNLRKLLDELFGEENFIGQLVWKSRVSEDTRAKTGLSNDHEYLLCYRRSPLGLLRGTEKDTAKFSNPDADPRGPWRSADLTGLATKDRRPNLPSDLIDPATKINYGCPPKGWRYGKKTMAQKVSEGRILWPATSSGRPRHKLFLNEMGSAFKNTTSVILDHSTADGTRETNAILGVGVFDFPKPVQLMEFIVEQGLADSSEGGIVLDFFAGSGVMGEAVMRLNIRDGGSRRFLLVQLPEPTDREGYSTISQITKARLSAVGKQLYQSSSRKGSAEGSTGFRSFCLAASNIKSWDADFDTIQTDLIESINHIKPDRTEQDVLYELLLKYGFDLAISIETRRIEKRNVYIIGTGSLVVCLANDVTLEVVNAIAHLKTELKPAIMRVVFKDSGFVSDVVKTNATQILKRAGVDDVKSL